TFANCYSDNIGGAIANTFMGTLTLINSTINGCGADRGGGIENGGKLTVTSSVFLNNGAGHAGAGIESFKAPSMNDFQGFLYNVLRTLRHLAAEVSSWLTPRFTLANVCVAWPVRTIPTDGCIMRSTS